MKECELLELYSFLGKKWAFVLLSNISEKPISFNQLNNLSNHLINPTLLSERLKAMIRFKLISKEEVGNRNLYLLTPEGKKLKEILHQLKLWSVENHYNLPNICKNSECVCSEVFKIRH